VGLRPIFGNACKFHPTCSCYAHEAYKKHNFLKATYLSTYRLLRCHPFSEGGLDPVPEYNKEALNG
jgi:putative membrane protein insertion efficiency factor